MGFNIVIEKETDEAAGFSAYCPSIPGCFSNGGTVEEAKENMRDAIRVHLQALADYREVLSLGGDGFWVEKLAFAIP